MSRATNTKLAASVDQPSRHESGAALILTMLVAFVVLTLGTTFVFVAMTDRRISSNYLDGSKTFNIAEAGIEHAIAELPNRDLDTLLSGGGTLFTNQVLGEGEYDVVISNNIAPDFPTGAIPLDAGGASSDTDGYFVVTSTGRIGQAERSIQIMMHKGGSPPTLFKWAAFGIDELKGSNSIIYGAAGSNGDIKFSGSAPRVVGDAQAVGTISSGYVTGTATEGAPPEVHPPVSCPAQPYGPAPTCPSPPCSDVSLGSSDGKLKITGPAIFNSGTYYFSEFSKSGGDDIVVPLGADVQIFVGNKIAMSGGGFTNLNGKADTLQLWGCGPGTGDWAITGPQNVWMTIYAPGNKVKFTGGGHKNGSFIGKTFENSGPGNTIYDNSLTGGGGTTFTALTNTWTEVW